MVLGWDRGRFSADLNGTPTDLFLRPGLQPHEYHLLVTHMMARELGSSEFSKSRKKRSLGLKVQNSWPLTRAVAV
jgi:hypothetical protein